MHWYYHLNRKDKSNLLSNYKEKEDDVIVCWETEYRKFACFSNYRQLIAFQEDEGYSTQCFYEIALANKMRKIYFDVDIEDENVDGDKLIEELKKALIEELNEEIIIMIFTSHTIRKKSYHVVLPDFCLENEKACSNFHSIITSKLNSLERDLIDSSVYKSVQNFRILGSHKYGKDNVKVFSEKLSYNFKMPSRYVNERAKYNFIFLSSLISKTNSCLLLSQYNQKEDIEKRIINNGTASEGDLDEVLDAFYVKYDSNDFEYSDIVENNGNLLITLRRRNPTYCKNCKRVHENENPFLTVKGVHRDIYFHCRRGDSGTMVKSLGKYEPPEIDISEIAILDNAPCSSSEDEEDEDVIRNLSNRSYERKKKEGELKFHGLSPSIY